MKAYGKGDAENEARTSRDETETMTLVCHTVPKNQARPSRWFDPA
jgi:hypothetical protein